MFSGGLAKPCFSGTAGFHEWLPVVPPKQTEIAGTKFANTVLCGCSNATVSQVYYKIRIDHCIGFHEQRKHLRKVPLQQKG